MILPARPFGSVKLCAVIPLTARGKRKQKPSDTVGYPRAGWRRRESNPRPKVLCVGVYVRIP
jgi:hypothetical protein